MLGEIYRKAIKNQIKNELIVKNLVSEIQNDEAFEAYNIIHVENEKQFSNVIGL